MPASETWGCTIVSCVERCLTADTLTLLQNARDFAGLRNMRNYLVVTPVKLQCERSPAPGYRHDC